MFILCGINEKLNSAMFKRKLTNILKRTDNQAADLSNMQWSSQSYTLKDIVDNFKLPLVVKCSDTTCTVNHGDFQFDLGESILLHSRKWTRKIKVSCLQRDAASGQITEIQPHYIIPEEHEGWFQIIDSPVEKATPDTTLETVVESAAEQFLSAKSLSCLSLVTSDKESPSFVRRHIDSGEVFTVRGLYQEEGEQRVQIRNVYKEIQNHGHAQSTPKFLVCTDEKDDHVLIDTSQKGCFYRIFEREENGRGLLGAEDLIDKSDKFPLLIRHVFGELPIVTSSYSSVMKCIDVVQEESALAATLLSQSPTLLELQCKSPIRFKICLNEALLKNSESCTEALQMCQTEGNDFLSGIKIAFTIQKQCSGSLENIENIACMEEKISNSLSETQTTAATDTEEVTSVYDSISEYGEEDANSEFSFAWTPEPLIKNKNNVKEDRKTTGPKFFNSSLNSPMASKESKLNAWNEQPDVV